MSSITYDFIQSSYAKYGYKFYDQGKYNINLFGIRPKNPLVNEFGCILGVAYLDEFLIKQCLTFRGSTLPGLYYLKNKLGNVNGTFILAPGQHVKCWKAGYHHIGKPNQYEAYQQAGPGVFKGYRDNDKDGQLDMTGTLYTDVAGLNGHTTKETDTDIVGAYSAGCQVVRDDKEHAIWLNVGKRSAELYGNLFTYTLFQRQ